MGLDWSTFGYTDEQKMMRESVMDLLARELPPERIRKMDEDSTYPVDAYNALVRAGWLGLPFSEEDGGTGGSKRDLVVLVEALGYHWSSMATAYLASTIYAGQHIALNGSPYLKKTFIPKIIDGSSRMAIALSEPEAGSDAAAIRTRAEKKGDRYIVNGQKLYITCAHVAQHLAVALKTDPGAGHKGLSMLLVPTNAKGVEIRPMDTLGRRATRANEVFFADVEVPVENLIGEENGGWKNLMKCLNLERLCLAAGGSGSLMHVIDYTLDYAQERRAFGQTVASFQTVQHKLAEMRIMAESSRTLTWRVAEMLDAGLDPRIETAIAKVVATDADFRASDLGLQIMGGAGYTMAHDMQRFFRDSRVGPIGGGSNEIQKNIIARLMGL